MESTTTSTEDKAYKPGVKKGFFKNNQDSVGAKVATIIVLLILFLIPISNLEDLLEERQETQKKVVREIANSWGQSQQFGNLVLRIPVRVLEDKQVLIESVLIEPSELFIDVDLTAQTRKRGIYQTVLYTNHVSLKGTFPLLEHQETTALGGTILWEQAQLEFVLYDVNGLQSVKNLKWNNEEQIDNFEVHDKSVALLLPTSALQDSNGPTTFSFDVEFLGSESLDFIASGRSTEISLSSNWDSPSFTGSHLPNQSEISKSGVTAKWKITDPTQNNIYHAYQTSRFLLGMKSVFGMDLVLPVSHYQMVNRSIKYSILFVSLTFASFFLFEVIGNLKLHLLQYLMIGLAICLFFLNLLSLSEFIEFMYAYLISAIATILLIGTYAKAVLKESHKSWIMVVNLVVMYAFLGFILTAESFALLGGSLGLFAILSLVMYLTRNINWHQINMNQMSSTQRTPPDPQS